jgi:hypothetical protein
MDGAAVDTVADVKYALRRLKQSLGFTATVVVMLADFRIKCPCGGMAEWSMAVVLKTAIGPSSLFAFSAQIPRLPLVSG